MDMNSHWIQKSLEYHGLPLKSIWDGERGDQELVKLGLTSVDYSVYRSRQKTLTLSDRGTRLKLHQFIAKNAAILFDSNLGADSVSSTTWTEPEQQPQASARGKSALEGLPPFEFFLKGLEPERVDRVLNLVQPGDLLYGSSPRGFVKAHCIVGSGKYHVDDLPLRVSLATLPQGYKTGTKFCCEVVYKDQKSNRLFCDITASNKWLPEGRTQGIISEKSFPEFYKQTEASTYKSYQEAFESSQDFKNPHCFELLYNDVGLDQTEYYSNMSSARGRYPPQEYAEDIRQVQASKLAFRSVAEGIEHFKEGRHSEAFHCLNKALSIDGRNVEGLVARGALYANSGSFKKAVEDFENALKLNPGHANARKYMGETLVALGRSYEEENNLEAAKKAYQDCLMIIPHHEEAQTSLEFLKSKMKAPLLIEPRELQLPEIIFGDTKKEETKRTKEKKGKKKKAAKNKKKYSSSSSSSGSSDNEDNASSDSSSGSSSNESTSSESDSGKAKKKKKDKKRAPQPPSPTSALLAAGKRDLAHVPAPPAISNDYELKVRNFLSEMTRDEDNYEDKVRKFVEETSKYRKDREKSDKKKRKKKDSKKTKKDSKKRKKEKGGKKEKKGKGDAALGDEDKLREALKIFENFPILDELGSKLQSLYKKDKEEPAAPETGKWKMMFAKDSRGPGGDSGPVPSTSKAAVSTVNSGAKQPLTKSAFGNGPDSDEERRRNNKKKSPSPVLVPIPPRPKYARLLSPASMNRPAPIRSGPVVLDKFGNFRLAHAELDPPDLRVGGRSRSRRRSSSSRSRSPGRRRRSRSFRSRSRSSRSYSRSRSRSRSGDRWRGRFRGGRGGGGGSAGFDRGYKQRFNHGGQRGGRGRGGRDWEFRGGGRGGNRDGFRPRGGRGNGARFNDRGRFDRLSRSRSFSPGPRQRSPDGRQRSPLRLRTPDGRQRSPDGRHRSPIGRQRSPDGRQRSPARSPSPPRGGGRRDRRSFSKELNRRDRPVSPAPRKASRRTPTPQKTVDNAAPPEPTSRTSTNNNHVADGEPPPPGCE